MSRKQYQHNKFFLFGQRYKNVSLWLWASIHCESKMENQDLQAGES